MCVSGERLGRGEQEGVNKELYGRVQSESMPRRRGPVMWG